MNRCLKEQEWRFNNLLNPHIFLDTLPGSRVSVPLDTANRLPDPGLTPSQTSFTLPSSTSRRPLS